MKKKCSQCNKEFSKRVTCSKKEWAITKCCSRICANKFKKTIKISDTTKEKQKIATLKRYEVGDMNGFKKGVTSWCYGTKGVMKSNKGSFRKGRIANNKGVSPSKESIESMIKTRIKNGSYSGIPNSEYEKARHSVGIKLWRKSCLERDNFTDQKTGIQGGQLQVHHINNFVEFKELRTSIDNGITLSKKSHKQFHDKYGYRNNTREQLLEFLNTK